jgi:hypothetical protein
MAKAKAKKKAPTRKKVVAKKSAPKKRTQTKRAVKKNSVKGKSASKPVRKAAAPKPPVVPISTSGASKPEILTLLDLDKSSVAPTAAPKFKVWGKKSALASKLNQVDSSRTILPTTSGSPASDSQKSPAAKENSLEPIATKPVSAKPSDAKVSARKKSTGNPELAEKVRSWGKKRRLTKDAYLAGLADAIENDQDLVVWASTDVLAVFPHSYAAQTPNRLYSLLVLIRNVLVFAPVALTWLAISEATSAFAIYTTKETGTVANFLQFWEDGYGYLDDKWTISHVAVLDFQLVLAVIILTLLTELYSNRTEDRAEKDDLDSERERVGLAVEVMAYLFDKRGVNNVTMNSALARSVQNLRTSSKSLNDAAKRIEKVAKSLPNNAAIIQEIRKVGK